MKNLFLIVFLSISTVTHGHSLIINEIMSNPIGDDGGREWIEVYNNSSSAVDVTTLTISIKGATAVSVIPLSGGVIIPANGYVIIGSTVSGVTKFLIDYPTYNGPLFKSSISLVNTGVTSVEIKLGGVSADILASYTAAKEGSTLSRFSDSFSVVNPTPGAENQATGDTSNTDSIITATTTNTQATIAQAVAPASDIVLYLPTEKTAVAGAELNFPVFGLTRAGKQIENLVYTWAYGDGGQGAGSSTMYRYAYPGRYIATVEGGNGYVNGIGRMNVRVVAPDILIKGISTGRYGTYIDIENPNNYDLDFSQWRLSIDGAIFPFPKNTLIAGNGVTHLSGMAMGFASTTITANTIIKILFPNLEEVVRYSQEQTQIVTEVTALPTASVSSVSQAVPRIRTSELIKTASQSIVKNKQPGAVLGVSTTKEKIGSTTAQEITVRKDRQKDTRIVMFFRSLFNN